MPRCLYRNRHLDSMAILLTQTFSSPGFVLLCQHICILSFQAKSLRGILTPHHSTASATASPFHFSSKHAYLTSLSFVSRGEGGVRKIALSHLVTSLLHFIRLFPLQMPHFLSSNPRSRSMRTSIWPISGEELLEGRGLNLGGD